MSITTKRRVISSEASSIQSNSYNRRRNVKYGTKTINQWDRSYEAMREIGLKDVRAHCYCASLLIAQAIHWSSSCHIIFKRAHRVENSTKYRANDLCVNLVREYFCWMLGDPHFFLGRHTSFSDSFHYTKKQKNLHVGSFNYFSYTIQIGSN